MHKTQRSLMIAAIIVLTVSCTARPSTSETPTPLGAVVPKATQNPQTHSLPALEAQATLVQSILEQPIPVQIISGLDQPRDLAQRIAVLDARFQGDMWMPPPARLFAARSLGCTPCAKAT